MSVSGGGILDIWNNNTLTVGAGAGNLITNFSGGVYQFSTVTPTITTNGNAGGSIFIHFAVTPAAVVTEIEDTGKGLAPEIAGKLFEPFATFGKSKGTGLGLSICRRIIQDHGGVIQARSEPGRGAIFSFRLPRPQ